MGTCGNGLKEKKGEIFREHSYAAFWQFQVEGSMNGEKDEGRESGEKKTDFNEEVRILKGMYSFLGPV